MEAKVEYGTRELAVRRDLTPQSWMMIQSVAPAMHKARLFGVANPEQAMAIMLKGYKLGLSLTASFEFVQVVEGKPTLSPRGCLALLQQSPVCKRIAIEDKVDANGAPLSCTVTMERDNGFSYTVEYSMEDAERAGLVKPRSGWEKYPANMLRWRAVGFCADVVFPDVIGGMKRADELGAEISPDGDVIDTQWTQVPDATEPGEALDTAVPSYATVDQLLEAWSAEDIMVANEGKIPATPEECIKVAMNLGGGTDG